MTTKLRPWHLTWRWHLYKLGHLLRHYPRAVDVGTQQCLWCARRRYRYGSLWGRWL